MRKGVLLLLRCPTQSLLRCTTSAHSHAHRLTWAAPSALALLAATAIAASACAGGSAGSPGTPPAGPTGALATSTSATGAAAQLAEQRADAATDALVKHFWAADAQAFVASPDGETPAAYWIAAQALDSVLDGVERSGGQRWSDVAAAFIAAQDAHGWSRDWFDDESWMALALIRASDITGDRGALARADALMDDIQANASDDGCCGTTPGGLWWDRAHTQKATAANAGAVIAAARLFEHERDPRRLAFAKEVFGYWLANMVDPVTGHVADHVDPAGNKVWWRFTYNEGAMIGAALALQHATGDASYLGAAKRIGAFVLAQETTDSASGKVLFDGAACSGDCEQFKGIAQRYLAALADADPGGGWSALLQRDAAAVWDLARNATSDTFGVDWGGPPRAATLSTQSSATVTLDRAARVAAR